MAKSNKTSETVGRVVLKQPPKDMLPNRRKKIKYIAQDRWANCGPTAIVNTLLYLGMELENIDIFKIEAFTGCNGSWGTGKSGITKLLKAIGVRFTEIRRPKIKDVEEALFNEQPVIYLYMYDGQRAHYVFFYGQDRSHFFVANDIDSKRGNVPTSKKPKRYYLNKAIKHPGSYKYKFYGVFPHAWVIKGWGKE